MREVSGIRFDSKFLGRDILATDNPIKHFDGKMTVYSTGDCCEGYVLLSGYEFSDDHPHKSMKIFPIDFVPRTVVPVKDITRLITENVDSAGTKRTVDCAQPQFLVAGYGCSGSGIRLVTRDVSDVNFENYSPVQGVFTPNKNFKGAYKPTPDEMISAYEEFVGHDYKNKDWTNECLRTKQVQDWQNVPEMLNRLKIAKSIEDKLLSGNDSLSVDPNYRRIWFASRESGRWEDLRADYESIRRNMSAGRVRKDGAMALIYDTDVAMQNAIRFYKDNDIPTGAC